MNVTLTDKLEGFVNQLVEQPACRSGRGRYRSASEAVPLDGNGLRLLEIREAQLQPKPDTKKKPKS